MKRHLAIAIAALAVPCAALAQQATPLVAGNMSLVTDYRFRGISQTLGNPALQGGFDYAHASGIYLGNWNSNVSSAAGYPGGNLEMDFYGGWKQAFGDFGLDLGAIYYYYPGSEASSLVNPNNPAATNSGKVRNTELYIGGSWKWLSVKWFHSISDYFMVPDTSGTNYYDLSASYDLGSGWGLVGHVGRTDVHNFDIASYSDYKLGVTKDLSSWLFGASVIGTNAKADCGAGEPYCFAKPNGGTYDAGKNTVVLSVSRTF